MNISDIFSAKKLLLNKLNITCIGFNFQLDLILSLTQEQFTSYNINFNNLQKLGDLENKITEKILPLITITTNDFLFNVILFINRANKIKSRIKYIIPFHSKIIKELSFCENILNDLLKREGIEIIPLKLMNKNMQLNFYVNLINNENKIIETKKFAINTIYEYSGTLDDNNNDIFCFKDNIKNKKSKKRKKESIKINKEDNKKIQILINVLNKCNYIISSASVINNMIKIFKDLQSFEMVIDHLKSKKLCIIYDEIIYFNYTEKIMSITDIYIFEKKLLKESFIVDDKNNKNKNVIYKFINYFTNKIEQIENKTLKIEIIIDNLEEISIIQHDSTTKLVANQITTPLPLYHSMKNNKNNREEFINNNFNYFNSVYIGAFLSRLLYKKTFNTCLNAAVLCTKKAIKMMKEKYEGKKNKVNDFFQVLIPKKINFSKSMEDYKNFNREEKFLLDGNNKCEMNKKNEYNSLYDSNCLSFFSSVYNRKTLYKNGVINKKGRILFNPSDIKKSNENKNKRSINYSYQNRIMNLLNLKEKNKICNRFLQRLSKTKMAKFDNISFNIESFNDLSIKKFRRNFLLPYIGEDKNKSVSIQLFGKYLYNNKAKNNDISGANLNKRYFIGKELKKIFYRNMSNVY